MAHAELCPVCGGTGKIKSPTFILGKNKTCHGCGGSGWVEVRNDHPLFYQWDKEKQKIEQL